MRKLLITLAFIPVMAHSEALFETPNKGGGKIVLTDDMCSDGKNRMAYSTHPQAETSMGCWAADRSNIHIRWDTGQLRSYDYNGWHDVRSKKPNT
jgi:hypothetical protein